MGPGERGRSYGRQDVRRAQSGRLIPGVLPTAPVFLRAVRRPCVPSKHQPSQGLGACPPSVSGFPQIILLTPQKSPRAVMLTYLSISR